MLVHLATLIEKMQGIIQVRGGNPEDLEVEIRCRSVSNWAILDGEMERELMSNYPFLVLSRPVFPDVPFIMEWNNVPIRITYGEQG